MQKINAGLKVLFVAAVLVVAIRAITTPPRIPQMVVEIGTRSDPISPQIVLRQGERLRVSYDGEVFDLSIEKILDESVLVVSQNVFGRIWHDGNIMLVKEKEGENNQLITGRLLLPSREFPEVFRLQRLMPALDLTEEAAAEQRELLKK